MKLYNHQQKMINQAKPILDKYALVYIAAETRTGKSIATIHLLKDDYESILVLTKKKAISSWESDLKLSKANNFTVTNYESIHKLDGEFDCLVLDESHSIGSFPKPSQRAKQIQEKYSHLPVVYLSATPSAEAYSQLYHQFWISENSPFVEYPSFYKWYKAFGDDDSFMMAGRLIRKYKAIRVDEVIEQISHLIVTMTKIEANFDVLVNTQKHLVNADPRYMSFYESFENRRVVKVDEFDIVAESAVTLLNKLHQFSGGTIKVSDNLALILSMHKVNYIKRLTLPGKIVILCNYVKERELLLQELDNSTDDVEQFKNGDSKYFVGHIKTFSEGVDFSYAESMVIYSLSFSATTYIQSKERLANKKRTKPIVVHYLLTKNSIDEYVYAAVSEKMNFTSSYYKRFR